MSASSNPGALLNLKSRKHMIRPPKIKISEAKSQHTASLPVGNPEAVLMVEFIDTEKISMKRK